MDLFGKRRIRELEQELAAAREAQSVFEALGTARRAVKTGLEKYLDSLPPAERRDYVTKVVGLDFILRKQLEQMINTQYEMLGRVDLTEKGAALYRSNINVLQLIVDWLDEMGKEHRADIEIMRAQAEQDATLVSDLSTRYNLKP